MTDPRIQPARWSRHHLDQITDSAATTAPLILGAPPRILPDLDIWDMWPIQEEDNSVAVILGRELWMGLTAPAVGHPEDRHDVARIRLLGKDPGKDDTKDDTKDNSGWADLGDVFPDGASLGSREWSGSAIRRPDGTLSIYYTAAGRRGETRPTFIQRIAESRPELAPGNGWIVGPEGAVHREIVRSDGRTYLMADDLEGGPGKIRAFRDPAWFRDPADGREYLLIAASTPWRDHRTGAIALAAATPGGWTLHPPLFTAAGLNREIERPHIVYHDSSYYLFFCTHRQSFDPPNAAPTGLYGLVAPTLTGPYEPLNGSGLVIGNPPAQPDQAYAWLVLDDLRVVSFLNYRIPAASTAASETTAGADEARATFGGTVAPFLRLILNGTSTAIGD